jgi:hypothetical protein
LEEVFTSDILSLKPPSQTSKRLVEDAVEDAEQDYTLEQQLMRLDLEGYISCHAFGTLEASYKLLQEAICTYQHLQCFVDSQVLIAMSQCM